MTCDHVRGELAAYLEGLLDPVEAETVAEHLSACPACFEETRRQKATWSLLGADEPLEAPADLARRVLEEVRREVPREPARVIPISRWRRWALPALAAAAVLVVALGSFLLRQPSSDRPLLSDITEEERQVVAHLDLLEDFELLNNLEMLENLEFLEHQEVVQNL